MVMLVGAGRKCAACAVLFCLILLHGGSMAFAVDESVRTPGQEREVYFKQAPSPSANKNFRARITYKSGHAEDFLIVAETTNAFDNMRERFLQVAAGAPVQTGVHAIGEHATVVVRWTDVTSFYTWQD